MSAVALGDVAIGPAAAKSAEERVAGAPLIGEPGWRAVQAARMAAARAQSAQNDAAADPPGTGEQHQEQQQEQDKEDDGEEEKRHDAFGDRLESQQELPPELQLNVAND